MAIAGADVKERARAGGFLRLERIEVASKVHGRNWVFVVPIYWPRKLILAKVLMPLKTKYVDMSLLVILKITKTD